MKQLKPGQLCTIYGKYRTKHVYRCVKNTTSKMFNVRPCTICGKSNNTFTCILLQNGVTPTIEKCLDIFGEYNYPVLVK